MTTLEELKKWVKEQGFTYIKQTSIFGDYFKVDKDGFANKIRWVYNDSNDMYYVKWQSWVGNDKEHPKLVGINFVPERKDGICLEAETDNEVFSDHIDSGFHKMITYIKENNDKMIGLCKDNINKRLKTFD